MTSVEVSSSGTASGSDAGTAGSAVFRRRLLDGLTAAIAERGYRETTVSDIVRHARTSKRTFYSQFASKDDCLLELLDTDNAEMIADIRGAVDPQAHWRTQIEQAVNAFVRTVESRPAVSLCWIRELPALGEAARPVQRRSIDRLADMLQYLTDTPGLRRARIAPMTRPIALILLGGLRELTAHTLENGGSGRDITDAAVAASIALVDLGGQAAD
jgi:AcrR family transcriptional regulator